MKTETENFLNKIKIGTEIHYTGDMANQPGEGFVSKFYSADKFSPISFDVTMDDGRVWHRLNAINFSDGAGCRFYLLEDHKNNLRNR